MTEISEPARLTELAAEFPGYHFSTQQTWAGVSLIAVRQDGPARPGLYAVITADLDEMRCALLEGEGREGLDGEGCGDPAALAIPGSRKRAAA